MLVKKMTTYRDQQAALQAVPVVSALLFESEFVSVLGPVPEVSLAQLRYICETSGCC